VTAYVGPGYNGREWPGHEQPHNPDQEVRFYTLIHTLSLPTHWLYCNMADTLRYFSQSPLSANVPEKTNPLTAVIRRLEAATSRLEDIATSAANYGENGSASGGQQSQGQQRDVSAASAPPPSGNAVSAVSTGAGAAPEKPAMAPVTPAIMEMDQLIDGEVENFVEAAKGLDPLVESQVSIP